MNQPIDLKTMKGPQYEIVATNRQIQDQMLWETPVLSLTALSFLFTIALGSGNSTASRLISASLAAITSFASLQLLIKHRALELHSMLIAHGYEKTNDFAEIHQRPHLDEAYQRLTGIEVWLARRPSYYVWLTCLSCFFAASLLVIVIAIFCPGWF